MLEQLTPVLYFTLAEYRIFFFFFFNGLSGWALINLLGLQDGHLYDEGG